MLAGGIAVVRSGFLVILRSATEKSQLGSLEWLWLCLAGGLGFVCEHFSAIDFIILAGGRDTAWSKKIFGGHRFSEHVETRDPLA